MSSKSTKHEIQEGDYVGTKYRGGARHGVVTSIEGGKATFKDQHGHEVSHKFETLAVDPDRSESTKKLSDEEKEELKAKWKEEMGGN